MKSDSAVIFVVDDDRSVRNALERLIKSVGFRVKTFDRAQSFLDSAFCESPCCLVLDVRMPQMSGIELQEKMALKGLNMPVIFITGHGTVSMGVQAMKAGAIDFIEKPFEDQQLIETIQAAIDKDRQTKQEQAEIMQIRHHLNGQQDQPCEHFPPAGQQFFLIPDPLPYALIDHLRP